MTSGLLTAEKVSKTFGTSTVLDGVSFSLRSGEVLAVLGQNGSGKSTLVKVLAGVHSADPGGTVRVADDTRLHFIHQDLGLVMQLSTVENLALDRPMRMSALLPIRRRADRERALSMITRFGGGFDVDRPVSRLSPAERTIVAIARALSGWAHPRQVLVLDEPTAALHGAEVDRLVSVVKVLAAEGAGILFITHRLDEVFSLADRALFLRDGELVAERPVNGLDEAALVELIAGRSVARHERTDREKGAIALRVDGLRTESVNDLNLEVRTGEIVGVAGQLGSGRDEVLKSIFGAAPSAAGDIQVYGRRLARRRVRSAMGAGIGLVPGDRLREGLMPEMAVRENLTLPHLRPLRDHTGRVRRRAEIAATSEWLRELRVRPDDPSTKISLLSGGNQQKVMLARWLRRDPGVLLLEEPAQGVDVDAKALLYQRIQDAAAEGRAVVVASSDERELAEICDRVIVLRDGRCVAELTGAGLTQQSIISEALGITPPPVSPQQENPHA